MVKVLYPLIIKPDVRHPRNPWPNPSH